MEPFETTFVTTLLTILFAALVSFYVGVKSNTENEMIYIPLALIFTCGLPIVSGGFIGGLTEVFTNIPPILGFCFGGLFGCYLCYLLMRYAIPFISIPATD